MFDMFVFEIKKYRTILQLSLYCMHDQKQPLAFDLDASDFVAEKCDSEILDVDFVFFAHFCRVCH